MRDPRIRSVAFVAVAAVLALSGPGFAAATGPTCEKKSVAALRSCGKSVSKLHLTCIQKTGAQCLSGDLKVTAALASLEKKVLAACPDGTIVAAAGYGALLTPAALVDRLQESCTSFAGTLVARTFGGPHVAVRTAASVTDKACLDYAYLKARSMIDYGVKQQSKCVVDTHAGKICDLAAMGAKISAREAKTIASITAKCPTFSALTTLDPTTYVARAGAQSRCAIATAHGQTAPLTLDCGPRASIPVPPVSTATQVVLPNATYGSLCGDGTDYAFWIQLAPTGQPVNKVVFFLQGGGACYDAATCSAKGPDFFEALSDGMPGNGIMSSTDPTNPFQNWTKVFLPYCTQDLHIGGGLTNVFTGPSITVNRYGALNVRATMQYVRDVLWASMNATDADGYRPDRMQVVFSGSSAGGYGVSYNYHWVLDDLRWVHTTAVPDAGLGIDNGGVDGVITLGAVALLSATPGWNILPYLPPYCATASCAEIFTNLDLAHSPRLKREPEQQILHVTNQVDSTQRGTTNFLNMGTWTNAVRAGYCAEQGANGLHSFLRASSTPVHGQIAGNEFETVSIGGTLMREWLGDAMANPDSVVDKIATGTIVPDISGALPFPCTTSSPSGAFIDAQ